MNDISSYEAWRRIEAYKHIDAMRAKHGDSMSNVQKMGAFTMTLIGKITGGKESLPSSLEQNAYNPRFAPARRLYAALLATTMSATLIVGGYAADKIDNEFACRGKNGTAELAPGRPISDIVSQVPHNNTPERDVVIELAALNPDNFGYNHTTDSTDYDSQKAGTYQLPQECDSVLAMPPLH